MQSSTVPGSGWVISAADQAQNSAMQPPGFSVASSIIITVILLLVFVMATVVFLFIYSLYAVRHRFPSVTTTMAAAAPSSPGLDPSVLAAILAFPYKSTAAMNSDPEDASAVCAVCLSRLEEEEMVRVLPNCKHVFHVGCVDMWLHSHTTCPVCRADAEPKEPIDVAQPSALPSNEDGRAVSSSSSWLSSSFRRIVSKETSGRMSGRRVQPADDVSEELQRV